jgi:DNA-binding HxlR family transcriptional regulator
LREVFRGASRFDELQGSLDISRNLLTSRLKKLVDGGVLDRKPIYSEAKRLGYFLTPMGADLFATLVAIRQWGDRWLFEPGCTPADVIDSKKKKVLPRMRVRSADGEALSVQDISYRMRENRPRPRDGAKRRAPMPKAI